MSMVDMPLSIEREIISTLENCLKCSDKSSFYNNQVVTRIVSLVMVVFKVAVAATETIIGLGLFVEVILTRGNISELCKESIKRLHYPSKVISEVFRNILRTINPEAKLLRKVVLGIDQGLIYEFIVPKLKDKTSEYYDSKNFFMREIVTRLSLTLTTVAAVVARIFDTVIGIIAAAAAIITLGKITVVNETAHLELRLPGIMLDATGLVRTLINPGTLV